jgi:uridine kinase
MTRDSLVGRLADFIGSLQRPHPVRVAIDGPDAAGKTTLADELASALRRRQRCVIRASIDGFHRPRAQRYRRGHDSPRGYYNDSFDYEALRRNLLDPLGPNGSRRYRAAVYDFRADTPRLGAHAVAPDDALLLFDGVFLLRPEVFASWDLRIFVAADFDETLARALNRDVALFGSRAEVEHRYRRRYIPGQELYFAAARPTEAADFVVDNNDVEHPVLRTGARRADTS